MKRLAGIDMKKKAGNYIVWILCLGFYFMNCSDAQVREPAVAGMFYPASSEKLKKDIVYYLSLEPAREIKQKPFGIIAPHAGYVYSGPVAGVVYNSIRNFKYDGVIILSPSHLESFNFASVYSGDFYKTPLGKLAIDKKLAKKCCTNDKLVKFSTKGHKSQNFSRGEHAIEVHLPFIQEIYGQIPIVPIIIGTMNYNVLNSLGKKLGEIAGEHNVLVIASSDLSHFHDYQDCMEIDNRLIRCLEKNQPMEYYKGIVSNKFEACGSGPITALLIAGKQQGVNSVQVLKYANSGDVQGGDKSRVVGYVSAVLFNDTNKKILGDNMIEKSDELNIEEMKFFLKLAEGTVKMAVTGEIMGEPENIPKIGQEKRGAFVTLTKNGNLRGCIGYILPVKSLYETIIDVGTSATLRDPRFPAVTEKELKNIDVEVSVLTVPEKINDPMIIEVGKHGIIMKRGFHQGLLLPQVATEYNWDRETFLEHTCMKAGLPRNAWKDSSTEISIFSAQVFNRETLTEK